MPILSDKLYTFATEKQARRLKSGKRIAFGHSDDLLMELKRHKDKAIFPISR